MQKQTVVENIDICPPRKRVLQAAKYFGADVRYRFVGPVDVNMIKPLGKNNSSLSTCCSSSAFLCHDEYTVRLCCVTSPLTSPREVQLSRRQNQNQLTEHSRKEKERDRLNAQEKLAGTAARESSIQSGPSCVTSEPFPERDNCVVSFHVQISTPDMSDMIERGNGTRRQMIDTVV